MTELEIHEIEWVAVPKAPYIMKCIFQDNGYNIMMTNLTLLYSEKLEDKDILERFCQLNPFAQMKSQVILLNLKKAIQKCLDEDIELDMKQLSDKLVITLSFPVGLVSCNYDIEMNLMGAEKITQYIIGPTVFGALLSHTKLLELQKKFSSHENSKFSSCDIPIASKDAVNPEWLKGQSISIENILSSFLKIQNHFQNICSENDKAYNAIKKDKLKNESSSHSISVQKKTKFQELCNDESPIKFEDHVEEISIKKKKVEYTNSNLEPVKNIAKKKKIFKI